MNIPYLTENHYMENVLYQYGMRFYVFMRLRALGGFINVCICFFH